MKLLFFLLVALAVSGRCVSGDDGVFTRVNTGPGAIPNGSSAAAWGDFNNDGWIDLFVTSFGGTQYNYCYTNNGDGSFTRILPTFFPANNINSFGCAWADYDNDGYLDLVKGIFNTFGGNTLLYRNTHNGAFNNVTASSIGNIGAGGNNVVWGDYDNDGWVDLFVAVGYNAPDNVLLHNRGDGTFSRVTGTPMTTATGLCNGAAWGDYDNDGRLDLVVTRSGGPCLLYHNEGAGAFRQITNSPLSSDVNGAGVSWGDYDNDGLLDLFIAHSPNRLYHNNGAGSFTSVQNVVTQTAGSSTGGAWADFDNDGWLDLFVANMNGSGSFLFHNDGAGGFIRVTNSVVTEVGTGQGAAWGDYDNNGFPDLFVPNIFTYNSFLYRNSGNSNNWVTLKLEGRLSNRAAIGAKVRLLAMIQGRETWQLRQISGGGSLGSQDDLRVTFGLGDAAAASRLRIEWPSGLVEDLATVEPRQFLTIVEPGVLISPAQQQVAPGDSATFATTTSLPPPLLLQWRVNNVPLPGATNLVLTITNVQAANAGEYAVTVSNPESGLTVTAASAFLTGPVVVMAQPQRVAVRPGTNTSLAVVVSGRGPFAYQWRFNGLALPGSTNATLFVTNAQATNSGIYDVIIANSFGSVQSAPAALHLLIDPVIRQEPLSQSVVVGESVTFSVAVTGSPAPFSFEWRRGSSHLITNEVVEPINFLTLTNVQINHAGSYRVLVKNLALSAPGVLSAVATLTVLADADGDGLPDEWENAHGLSASDATDADRDADGDGMTNREEYRAGTDPMDPQSYLRVENIFHLVGGDCGLRFLALSNRTYTLQSRAQFDAGEWSRELDVVAARTNRWLELSLPVSGNNRVFRLVTPRRP